MTSSTVPRVVISGIGVVSPFGVGRERFWTAVSAGQSGTRTIGEFDIEGLPSQVAAVVPPVSMNDVPAVDRVDAPPGASGGWSDSRADPRRYSRTSLIAVIAASEAWKDAGLRACEPDAGVIVGSGAGGIDVAERHYQEYFTGSWRKVTPYAIPVSIVGMVSSEISIALGLRGISHVLSTGCTSSTDAIGYAARLIRCGEADVLLTGGADACVTRGMMLGFARMHALTTRYNDRPAEASRPFERDRDGFVLGEGAWMLVVEREDRARARGVRPYAGDRRLRIDLRCLPPRADGSGRRGNYRRDAPGARPRRRPAGRRSSATSTSTARRRCSTTRSNRGVCARCSATMPTGCRGRRRSR